MLTSEQRSALRQASQVMYDSGYPSIASDLDEILASTGHADERECCNADCRWVGPASETVQMKHSAPDNLCPNCYEVTEAAIASTKTDEGRDVHAELMAKIEEYGCVRDKIGRSRQANNYAANESAVKRSVDLKFEIDAMLRAALATAPTKPTEAQVRAITDWPGYWIDGQKVSPQDYIAWLLKQLESTEAARLPEPKYYGTQEGDGAQHEVKCAYVDGWNDCRKAMPSTAPTMSEAVRDVLAERRRQVEVEGWTPEHDNVQVSGEIALAAGCYAIAAGGYAKGKVPPMWPWDLKWWKPSYGRRDLIKAGALILAEIECIDRAAAKGGSDEPK